MFNILIQESSDENKTEVLRNLCRDFGRRRTKPLESEKRSYIPKELSNIQSPDRKYRLTISESGENGEFGMTTFFLNGTSFGISLYDVQGINLHFNAYWEDENTIIIESEKEYKAFSKHRQIQVYDDVIEIKYRPSSRSTSL